MSTDANRRCHKLAASVRRGILSEIVIFNSSGGNSRARSVWNRTFHRDRLTPEKATRVAKEEINDHPPDRCALRCGVLGVLQSAGRTPQPVTRLGN